jgi:hypothetical protein
MKPGKLLQVSILALSGTTLFGGTVNAEEEFTFDVTNSTKTQITALMVSADKKDWGDFDIGAGIKPGETVTLAWDKSTNDQACQQWIIVKYADGSEAEATRFDFCEEDLSLEFSE